MGTYIPDPGRILLVNESELQQSMIINCFDHDEFEFHTAPGGAQAIQNIHALRQKGISIDVVVVDKNVPDSLKLAGEIRNRYSSSAVVMITDEIDRNIMREYILAGAVGAVTSESFENDLPGLLRNLLPNRILAVDDNSMTREIVKQILNDAGMKVCQASDGTTAIEQCKKMRSIQMLYDLLLLDVKMEGLDGISTFEVIRGYIPDAKGLVFTSHTSNDIIIRCKEAGLSGCIKKVEAEVLAKSLPCKLKSLLPKKLLFADDSDLMREAIRAALEEKKYKVVGEATDGLEAFELYKSLHPQGVVLDVKMPGMDGIESLQKIRAYEKSRGIMEKAYIVMHTSENSKEMVAQCLNAGANSYVIKPEAIDETNLMEKFAPLFDKFTAGFKKLYG